MVINTSEYHDYRVTPFKLWSYSHALYSERKALLRTFEVLFKHNLDLKNTEFKQPKLNPNHTEKLNQPTLKTHMD